MQVEGLEGVIDIYVHDVDRGHVSSLARMRDEV